MGKTEKHIPCPGEFYRHFKGNLYQVKFIAKDSETKEKQVVYQAMYPPYEMWVRPLDMFISEVDTLKYPDCKQKYRFEKIDMSSEKCEAQHFEEYKENTSADEFLEKSADISDAEIKEALINDAAEKKLEGRISKREIAERGFMELLDSDSYREKYLIFIGLRNYIDKRLLNNIAVALDIVIDDTDEEQQYDSILRCLQTFDKFETNRLR
ncbi:MAG: DUF1653 domain-containing protein [Lachnospiraceae bacterium]|nr:DUF1653 domain-containing protein [Lachnospiraceae bacterium]MBQ2320704.1 DUF1653 domain-containing protein [Lachnospiraceae bacterium]